LIEATPNSRSQLTQLAIWPKCSTRLTAAWTSARRLLHAEAGAVEAIGGCGLDPIAGEYFWVELRGDLSVRADVEGRLQGPEDQVKLVRVSMFGVPPPRCTASTFIPAGQGCRQHSVFPQRIAHIVPNRLMAVHRP